MALHICTLPGLDQCWSQHPTLHWSSIVASVIVKSCLCCKYSTIKHVSTDKALTNSTGWAKDGQTCHLIKLANNSVKCT